MSEELNNQPVTEQEASGSEELVATDVSSKKSFFARLNILEHLQKIMDIKWVTLSSKLSNIVMYISFAIAAYLGLIGYGFDVAFIALLVTAATAFYSTLLAGATVLLSRGKKRRVRKKAKRLLFRTCFFLLTALLLLLFSNIPYYDGRYGNSFHFQGYDAFYFDVISEEGEQVVVIRTADEEAQVIKIPDDIYGHPIKYIDADAFLHCTKLSKFLVNAETNQYFKAENGILYSKDMSVLLCYPQQPLRFQNIVPIHEAVTEIGDYAFAGSACSTVTMPNVTKIGDHAFDGCNSLTNIDAPKLTSIGDYAFANCTQLRLFDILGSVSYVGDSAFCNMPTTSVINVFASSDVMSHWSIAWDNGCRASIEKQN